MNKCEWLRDKLQLLIIKTYSAFDLSKNDSKVELYLFVHKNLRQGKYVQFPVSQKGNDIGIYFKL